MSNSQVTKGPSNEASEPKHHPEQQQLQIPFTVPGRKQCSVTFTIKPDDDPTYYGQGTIGLYEDENVVKGFPVVKGTVSSPSMHGYASIYGWVQITYAPGEDWVMDPYPPFQDVNTPFAFWGAEPTLVDCPGRQGVRDYKWWARSFLCYSPDACMTKTVVPVVAFEWGFWIEDHKPYVRELRRLDVEVWNGHLGLFRGKYPAWDFREVGKE